MAIIPTDNLAKTLAKRRQYFHYLPSFLRRWGKGLIPITRYNEAVRAQLNPLVGTPYEWEYQGKTPFRLGIIFDPYHYHQYYQFACLDMEVSYRVIDILRNDWLEQVKSSDCRAFLVWPPLGTTVLKEIADERIWIMEDLGLMVYPSYKEIWFLDNKRRVYHWLKAKDYPVPQFWDFCTYQDAMEFINNTSYPVVFKSVHGGVSSGVVICRSPHTARLLVKNCFNKGFLRRGADKRDRQWDYILFQEYLPEVDEHRIIRINESFIYLQKVRRGDFHSGSGVMKWGVKREDLFNLALKITNDSGFDSMDVDIFQTREGKILINELHTVFGGPVVPDDDQKGRYKLVNGKWVFETGNFYRNYCANLRVERVIGLLNQNGLTIKPWYELKSFFSEIKM